MRSRAVCGVLFLVALVFATAGTTQAQATADANASADAAHTLSDAQKQSIKNIQTAAEKQAALAALRLAGIVNKIYENMLADKPDERLRASLSAQMEKATWALLSIKGQSIHDIVRVLTPAQRRLVKAEMQKPGAPSDLSEVVAHVFKLDNK
jgi:Spy/CpxP family protein refolding chaperone